MESFNASFGQDSDVGGQEGSGLSEGHDFGWDNRQLEKVSEFGQVVEDTAMGTAAATSYSVDDSSGYTARSSKALEASLSAAKSLVDPLTKSIPWEHLPKDERLYSFGPEFVQFLSDSVRIRLLIENRMAWGGAGHCRKLTTSVANQLESLYSFGLSLWNDSGDSRDLLKSRSGTGSSILPNDSVVLEQDVVLNQWLGHYRKYLDKQLKKLGRVGVNLANIPYTAGPVDIKRAVEQLLGWAGSVSAIDPWWQKHSWNHDGTVTVYMPRVAANDLVERCQQQQLIIRPSKGAGGPRVIKAWLAKGSRSGPSQSEIEDSDSSEQASHVAQSLDKWA